MLALSCKKMLANETRTSRTVIKCYGCCSNTVCQPSLSITPQKSREAAALRSQPTQTKLLLILHVDCRARTGVHENQIYNTKVNSHTLASRLVAKY